MHSLLDRQYPQGIGAPDAESILVESARIGLLFAFDRLEPVEPDIVAARLALAESRTRERGWSADLESARRRVVLMDLGLPIYETVVRGLDEPSAAQVYRDRVLLEVIEALIGP